MSICTETWTHQIITFWPWGIPHGTGHICTVTVIILVSMQDRECDQIPRHILSTVQGSAWHDEETKMCGREVQRHIIMTAMICAVLTHVFFILPSSRPIIYPSFHPSLHLPTYSSIHLSDKRIDWQSTQQDRTEQGRASIILQYLGWGHGPGLHLKVFYLACKLGNFPWILIR